MRIDKIESETDKYKTLRQVADGEIDKNPAANNGSDYTFVAKVDGDAYGIKVSEGLGSAERALKEQEGITVYNTRENREVRPANILSDSQGRQMTVEEAARPLNGD